MLGHSPQLIDAIYSDPDSSYGPVGFACCQLAMYEFMPVDIRPMVKFLLDAGADATSSGGNLTGSTALHYVARADGVPYQAELMTLLIARGADPAAKDLTGASPRDASAALSPAAKAVFAQAQSLRAARLAEEAAQLQAVCVAASGGTRPAGTLHLSPAA